MVESGIVMVTRPNAQRLASAFLLCALAGGVRASTPSDPSVTWGTVSLPTGRTLAVEVADTAEKIQRGYMFRESVPEGEGMVFLLGRLDNHSFWMKNCRTSLDILWLDEQWRVVHIEANLAPCREDPCSVYVPLQRSLYALEVGGGQASKLNLKLGDRVAYIPPTHPSK